MKYYCEKQHDISDCAAACLVSIGHYYGYHIRVAKVREYAGTDQNGTTVDGIIKAAGRMGFDADAVRCNKEALFSHIAFPCIAHVLVNEQIYHYVVIHKVTRRYIWIGDPARGIVKVRPETFFGEVQNQINGIRYQWTGILIRFQKNDSFTTNKSSTGKFYLDLMKQEKKLLIQVILASAVYTILGLGGAIYNKVLIDRILPEHHKAALALVSGGILLAYLLKFVMNVLRGQTVIHMGNHLDRHLLHSYVERVLGLPLHFFERRKAGDLVSRFQDADKVKDAISSVVVTVAIDGVIMCIGLILLANTSWILFLWALLIISGYLVLMLLFRERFERYNTMWMEYNSDLSSGIMETLKGIETVKAYNMEAQMKEDAGKRIEKLMDCLFHFGTNINIQSTVEELLGLIGGVVILWLGGNSVIDGTMTVGQLILYYSLFLYFIDPVKNIVNLQSQLQTAVTAANRLIEVFEVEQNVLDRQDGEADYQNGDIVFQQVSFGYRLQKKDVMDVSLHIRQGEKAAVIGENGSGKSTLFKLLLGFYQIDEGEISIGGIPIEKLGAKQLRTRIGYVNQETVFFGESIRKNLQNGCEPVTDEEMVRICKMVKAHDFIMEQPFGYDTVMQEGGSNLSSGQRQRLALARALIKNPDILVLDEFTSNIDSSTEAEIIKILSESCSEKTIIFITHKMQAVAGCEKVYHMDHGRIEEIELQNM